MLKGCEVLTAYLLHLKEKKKGQMTAGCTFGWTLPHRNGLSVEQWLNVHLWPARHWKAENPLPFLSLSLPLLPWSDFLTVWCLYGHILHLVITATTFLPGQQNWTVPSPLSEVSVLDTPHSTSNFSSLLPCTHGMSTLGVLIKSLLCHLSPGPGKWNWSQSSN